MGHLRGVRPWDDRGLKKSSDNILTIMAITKL